VHFTAATCFWGCAASGTIFRRRRLADYYADTGFQPAPGASIAGKILGRFSNGGRSASYYTIRELEDYDGAAGRPQRARPADGAGAFAGGHNR
jgi:hypothetical protein